MWVHLTDLLSGEESGVHAYQECMRAAEAAAKFPQSYYSSKPLQVGASLFCYNGG